MDGRGASKTGAMENNGNDQWDAWSRGMYTQAVDTNGHGDWGVQPPKYAMKLQMHRMDHRYAKLQKHNIWTTGAVKR